MAATFAKTGLPVWKPAMHLLAAGDGVGGLGGETNLRLQSSWSLAQKALWDSGIQLNPGALEAGGQPPASCTSAAFQAGVGGEGRVHSLNGA